VRAIEKTIMSSFIDWNIGVEQGEMGRACCTNADKWNAYRILVMKPQGKKPLGRPRSRWMDNIKMDLMKI
jgi:hypothetical protein